MGSILDYYMGVKINVICGLLMNLWISAFSGLEYIQK